LLQNRTKTPFNDVNLCTYKNVGSNNNNLPLFIKKVNEFLGDASLGGGMLVSLDEVLASSSVVIALTELSATAPLKMLAKRFQFRGASMPGFLRTMIPTLSLDYKKVHERVVEFQERMDRAESVEITLASNGTVYHSVYDLRYRTAHASGGLMREPGIVGNLPSGEAYITPYEGERKGEPSRSRGIVPVQFDDEIVLYRIENNRAVEVLSQGRASDIERSKITQEPAYGNIAEVGIGVLGEWGVKAVGSTLLDEKLGLHIAFGRSEHFGGVTSPSSFRKAENVIHIDRVYVPSVQPLISVAEVKFVYHDGVETIIRGGEYVV
jgi:leucyl aminopeptidase (aminopeptidase T)